jgi:putative ABC transport system permease protein
VVSWYLAAKNVTRKKERSILTVLGVLLAVGSFVSLLSIAEGLYKQVQRELGSRNVDVYVLPKNAIPMPAGPIAGLATSTESIPLVVTQELAQLPNVDKAVPVMRFQQLHEGRSLVVWALDPTMYDLFLPTMKLDPTGRAPRVNNEIIMGRSLAQALNVGENASISLAGREYQIVGLFSTGSSLDDYFCYVMPEAAAQIMGRPDAQEVWLKLKEASGADVTSHDINNRNDMRELYVARTATEYQGAANEILNYAWLLQFAIAAVGVLIAITASMNTMLMSTYERLKEFATLRAIGGSRFTVLGMILTESMMLAMLGGLGGLVLGVMGSKLLDAAVVTLFKMAFPLASITWALLAESLALSAVVGLVGAAIPCFLVYRMSIISGLRQE